jgi:hypothetical protein
VAGEERQRGRGLGLDCILEDLGREAVDHGQDQLLGH